MLGRTQLTAAAIGAALVVVAVVAWHLHGATRYRAGYNQAQADAETQRLRLQEAMQYDRDRADAQYRGAVLARNAALVDLDDARRELDGLLLHARGADVAGTSRRPDDAGADWIGGFAACYAEYAELVEDAAGWADQVNGLQGYVRAIRGVRAD